MESVLSDRGQTHKHTERARESEREIEVEKDSDRDPVKRHTEQGLSELVVVQPGWGVKSRAGAYKASEDGIMLVALGPVPHEGCELTPEGLKYRVRV